MGRLTVAQLFAQIAGVVNQDATSPTAGNSEWVLWLSFINRAVEEWAEASEWEDLRKTFYPSILGSSQSSVPLPQDFKRLAGPVKLWGTGMTGGESWPVTIPEEVDLYNTTDKYLYVAGDISNGKYITWNPASLSSGASLSVPYFSIPTSLASPANVPVVPDSQYLVDRTIAYIFESRSDPRFQEQEQKAREKLLLMIENNSSDKYNSHAGRNYVTNQTRLAGFRIGRD